MKIKKIPFVGCKFNIFKLDMDTFLESPCSLQSQNSPTLLGMRFDDDGSHMMHELDSFTSHEFFKDSLSILHHIKQNRFRAT